MGAYDNRTVFCGEFVTYSIYLSLHYFVNRYNGKKDKE